MSNEEKLFTNGIVDFRVYESGEDDYSLSMHVDAAHVDTRICIAGVTSKQMIEIAVDMCMAAMPRDEAKQSKILAGVVEIQKVLAAWDVPGNGR